MADKDRDRNQDRKDARTKQGDSERDLERALERETRDLPGDTEENRNVSGSTTYQTLTDEELNERKRNR